MPSGCCPRHLLAHIQPTKRFLRRCGAIPPHLTLHHLIRLYNKHSLTASATHNEEPCRAVARSWLRTAKHQLGGASSSSRHTAIMQLMQRQCAGALLRHNNRHTGPACKLAVPKSSQLSGPSRTRRATTSSSSGSSDGSRRSRPIARAAADSAMAAGQQQQQQHDVSELTPAAAGGQQQHNGASSLQQQAAPAAGAAETWDGGSGAPGDDEADWSGTKPLTWRDVDWGE